MSELNLMSVGETLLEHGRIAEAILSFSTTNRHNFVAYALMLDHRMEEAEEAYARHLAMYPTDAAAYFNLGNAQREQLSPAAAARAQHSYKSAIQMSPAWADPYINLGVSYRNDMVAALTAYKHALALRPGHPHALCNAAHASTWLANWQDRDELMITMRGVLERAVHEADDGTLLSAQPWHLLSYHPLPSWLPRAVASAHARAALHAVGSQRPTRKLREPSSVGRLRIAYMSSDLNDRHPVGQLMSHVFALHDRARFRIECYATGPRVTSRKIELGCDRFDHVPDDDRLSDRRPMVHLLVDLNGHTEGARLDLIAARLAPVQASAVGYPAGLGGQLVDYVHADIASLWSVGPRPSADIAETLVLLPASFLVADHGLTFPHVRRTRRTKALRACSLSSFSQPYKLQPDTLQAWVGIVHRLRCSLELVQFRSASVDLLTREFSGLGASSTGRLRWLQMLERPDHLRRASAALLSLDTPGYNQGTSGLDALWAGLPLMTLPMRLWCSRMGASLLRAVSLPSGVSHSMRSMADLAVVLVQEPLRTFTAPRGSSRSTSVQALHTVRRPRPISVDLLGSEVRLQDTYL